MAAENNSKREEDLGLRSLGHGKIGTETGMISTAFLYCFIFHFTNFGPSWWGVQ